MEKFRVLNADEIDVRIAQISEKGASLLLYKDARVDMSILDETVGAERWQRKHYECKGNLFCSVGIKLSEEWIWKDDAGAESFTEKQKGEASDSFKRACVNWGIGRELYTSPFIWVNADKLNITQKNNKPATYDKFTVSNITIDEARKITVLEICNQKGTKVFDWYKNHSSCAPQENKPKQEQPKKYISKADQETLRNEILRVGGSVKEWVDYVSTQVKTGAKPASIEYITPEQYVWSLKILKTRPQKVVSA